MSSNRQSTKALTPEEQVNFHLAIQGKDGIELDGQYEQKKSGYSLLDGNFRRFLDHGREGVPILFSRMETGLTCTDDMIASAGLKGLLDKDFITNDAGVYSVYDKFFVLWLRSRNLI